MTVANYLTFSRLFIMPLFLFVYLQAASVGISMVILPYILLALLMLIEMSDVFDGYVARRYNQVTDLGKLLDPMADSIVRTSIFLTFTVGIIQLPIVYVFIFLYRDSVVSTLRTICALRGFTLAARNSGKLKAVIQAMATFAIVILMIPYSLGYLALERLQMISSYIVGFACFYSVLSLVDYFYANRQYIKDILVFAPKEKGDTA